MKTTESLWDNIRKRRAAGKRKLKPGDKNYPKTLDLSDTTTASIPNPAQTQMGPRFTATNVVDRRKKKRPALLKRFSKFVSDA